MAPTLRAGDIVFVDVRTSSVEEGDIVAVPHPISGIPIVKRVESIDEQGRLFLRSDNDDATDAADSRTFGPVAGGQPSGRISSRLPTR